MFENYETVDCHDALVNTPLRRTLAGHAFVRFVLRARRLS